MTVKVNCVHLDASESAFAQKQLEVVRAQSYDIKFPQLKGRTFVPTDNSVSPGAEVVTYRQYTPTGLAILIANYAHDLPRADVYVKEFSSKIRGIGTSYGFSIQEIRAAQLAGVPLEQRKANAARRAFEERIDALVQTGDTANNLLGFLNQPNASTYTIPAGAATTTPWSTKTADEIVADLHGIANAIVSSTKEVESPDTILIPLAQYTLIATKRMSTIDSTTVLQFFLKSSPYIKAVVPWYALTAAGAAGKDRMVCYRRDPDALQLIIPQEFEQMAPQTEGMEIVTVCHGRCGGVVVYYPLSMSYGDGI